MIVFSVNQRCEIRLKNKCPFQKEIDLFSGVTLRVDFI